MEYHQSKKHRLINVALQKTFIALPGKKQKHIVCVISMRVLRYLGIIISQPLVIPRSYLWKPANSEAEHIVIGSRSL